MTQEEKIEILDKLSKEDLIKIIIDISGGFPVNPPINEPLKYPWTPSINPWDNVIY